MVNNKLELWVNNANNRINNDHVIFIKNIDFLSINTHWNTMIDVINTNILQKDFGIKFRNSIITTNQIYRFEKLFYNNIKDGFIFIEDEESIKKFIYAIETKDISICNEIKCSLVKPVSLEIILKYSREDIKIFIKDRESILQAMNYKYVKFDEEDLEYFLEVYYNRKILIASFIQKLYRLAMLDFISSAKKIGGILSYILSTSSKTLTPKEIGILLTGKKPTNVKAYNLNINELEQNIKIKITTNLLKLNFKDLDITKISKITELPIKSVEKIYKKMFLR
ncbi:hypothetical protein [Aliarcobacter butzleri]|uniref:hypothetical protein n=1 Tax=Aliarcobacter butzleri TaxID=28197 RepID=UPI0021B2DC3C|nr:hypothetical protein [Aliarcobacter butzleri]MCT7602287.1 hypothetical protein [Aliarcobacter butzleri]MCT7606525.1 hypothetical protein [Aliarcobacter butzleri]MCT7608670.1 hypothetical protein [Aliarcobacter butzleri]